MDQYKYEVAISCLKEDVREAQELHDLLLPRVSRIFFYPEKQDELIGRDGIETFARAFKTDSRIVVVIYREGRGETPWTRVERAAIEEMCLASGWERVVVHSTDGTAPSWLPKFLIWSGARYGLSALAAAVEHKVKERGGNVGEEDPVAMAQRIRRQHAAASRREARRSTDEAVRAAEREVEAVYARLHELVTSVGATEPNMVGGQLITGLWTVCTARVAFGFRWEGGSQNSIKNASLVLYKTKEPLGRFGWQDENSRVAGRYQLHLAEDDTTWQWMDAGDLRYSSAQLADHAFRRLMAEHEGRCARELRQQQRAQRKLVRW